MLRDGRSRTVNARVQPLPGDADPDQGAVIQRGPLSGLRVVALSPALADRLGGDPFTTGVIIAGVQRGSNASRYRFQTGDLIREVGGRPVASVEAVQRVAGPTELTIERQGRRITGVVR